MVVVRGTDWSNYQPIPDEATCQALRDAGFTFAIVGLQNPDHGRAQTDALRAGGITVEDCYLENTPFPPIPAGMKRGWVAVEDSSGFHNEAAANAQLDYLRSQGLEAGIYTSVEMLRKYGLTDLLMGAWAGVPFWFANYSWWWSDKLPLRASMVQYSGSGVIPGIDYQLDLNYRPETEDTVEIRALDQAESIAALNKAAEVHGMAINDNNGFTIVEVVSGSPVPLQPGQRAYLFVTN